MPDILTPRSDRSVAGRSADPVIPCATDRAGLWSQWPISASFGCGMLMSAGHLRAAMLCSLLVAACAVTGCSTGADLSAPRAASAQIPQIAPDEFKVHFETTAGDFVMLVHRDWSPTGVERFYGLVKDHYFDDNGFFRVVPGFMVQWGLAADPAVTRKWERSIPDDPVRESNVRGRVTFAKTGQPDSRSSQIFVNFADNSRLDAMGFAPFAEVIEGMEIVDRISSAHGESPDQSVIRAEGNAYLNANFPQLDYIKTARLME